MQHTEIQTRLDGLVARMVALDIPLPQARLSLRGTESPLLCIEARYGSGLLDGGDMKHFSGATLEEKLEAAEAYLESLPDADTVKKNAWQRKLAAVIDEGNKLNLEERIMKPLQESSQAMTENLLAPPR